MKYIITFGSGQLENFAVNPVSVMLVMESASMVDAREPLHEEPFNGRYCTSYDYETHQEEFKRKYNMIEYTMEELLARQFNK